MFDKEKAGKAIVKLIKETSDGNVIWDVVNLTKEDLQSIDGEVIGSVYTTGYKGRSFKLYECKNEEGVFKYSVPIDSLSALSVTIRLEIMDPNTKRGLWTFPLDTNGLIDLYNTVKFKTADVDKVLDDILADD